MLLLLPNLLPPLSINTVLVFMQEMRSDRSEEWLSLTAALEAVSVSVGASAALSMAAASGGSASAAKSDNRRLRSAVYCRPRRSLYDRLARACEWQGVDAIGCGGEIRISHRAAPCRNVMQMRATWARSIASDADSNGTAWVQLPERLHAWQVRGAVDTCSALTRCLRLPPYQCHQPVPGCHKRHPVKHAGMCWYAPKPSVPAAIL